MQLLTNVIVALGLSVHCAFAVEWTVAVGKNETSGQLGIGFSPSVINPVVGDTIAFQFQSGTHSVVASSFDNPCVTTPGGFDTGIQMVADNIAVGSPTLPIAHFTVGKLESQWFYDGASGNCNKGAVFAVNPTANQTADAFKANALKAAPSVPSTVPAPGGSTATSSTAAPPPVNTSGATASYGFAASGWVVVGVASVLALGAF